MTRYSDLTKAQRWALADRLAEERLPRVNASCKPVCPIDSVIARFATKAEYEAFIVNPSACMRVVIHGQTA